MVRLQRFFSGRGAVRDRYPLQLANWSWGVCRTKLVAGYRCSPNLTAPWTLQFSTTHKLLHRTPRILKDLLVPADSRASKHHSTACWCLIPAVLPDQCIITTTQCGVTTLSCISVETGQGDLARQISSGLGAAQGLIAFAQLSRSKALLLSPSSLV